MATKPAVEALSEKVHEVLALLDKDLIRRDEWGAITFEAAAKDLERLKGIFSQLNILPLEHLPEAVVPPIQQKTEQTAEVLLKVDSFSLESGQPSQTRDALVNEIHNRAEDVVTAAAQWLPFLAFQRGDVEQNIKRLTKTVEDANAIVEEAREELAGKKNEIDKIVQKAREASAAAGAAVFTHDFNEEAGKLFGRAHKWLWATGVMAILTLVLAVVAFVWIEQGLDAGEIIQRSTAKLAILAIFFTGTLWCGRLYKALLHQATVNRHRALSLQTFQAFSSAAADDQTKDAVLLESTRAVFGPVATGFIDGGTAASSPQALQILELARSQGE